MSVTSSQRLQIRKWDEKLARSGSVLPILHELRVHLPVATDPARDAAKEKAFAVVRGIKRVRSVSCLADGGFVVTVELA